MRTLSWPHPDLSVLNRSTIITCYAINVRQGAENEGA